MSQMFDAQIAAKALEMDALMRENGIASDLALELVRKSLGDVAAELVQSQRKGNSQPQVTEPASPEVNKENLPLDPTLPASLVAFAKDIRSGLPDVDDIAFMHTVLCQLGLPRSKTDAFRHSRVCDSVAIQVDAGSLWDGEKFVDQPLPYGAFPRLILAQLNSEALRQKSPCVNVGPSASAFLRTLGITPTGGVNGSYTMFKKQVQSLAACRLTLGYSVKDRAYTLKGDIIEGFEAWTTKTTGSREMWPETVIFSDRYYENLSEHAVPVDMRALHALKGSALSLDLYMMLTERLHRLKGSHSILRWHQLHAQFGTEYTGEAGIRNFKRAFLKALSRVLAVYPKADVTVVKTGVKLKRSPPPVPYKVKS
ncbi:replication protein RepA [Halomonas sp. 86]|uniref:replication protein RepA n=1 Tax=unclassified Halomonas TaxID=2609666 RepID=UPI0040334798